MKNAMRVVAVAIPLMSTALPGSVFMYWTGEALGTGVDGCGVGLAWPGLGVCAQK